MPHETPPGWTELQERAKRAKDAKELSAIIDEMNRLLSAYEKAAGDGCDPDAPPPISKKPDRRSARRS